MKCRVHVLFVLTIVLSRDVHYCERSKDRRGPVPFFVTTCEVDLLLKVPSSNLCLKRQDIEGSRRFEFSLLSPRLVAKKVIWLSHLIFIHRWGEANGSYLSQG